MKLPRPARNHRRTRTYRSAAWVLLVLSLALLGCEDTTEPPPETPPTNTDPPNANALVTAHRIVGDPDAATSYYDLVDMEDGSFVVTGIQGGLPCVVRLQGDGTPMWTPRFTDYDISDTHVLTLPGGGRGLLAVGMRDANADGYDDRGVVALYDAGGALLHELVLGAPGAEIGLHDVEVLAEAPDHCELIVVGLTGADMANLPFRPLAVHITVQSDGSLVAGRQQSYPDLTGCSFRDVESDAFTSPAVYVNGNVYETGQGTIRAFLVRLSDSLEIEWSRPFLVEQDHRSAVSAGSLQVADGILYVVGESEVDKDAPPANGGHWEAGLAAAIAPTGQLLWLQPVRLTAHGESFAESWVDGPYLYAAGWCARYQIGTDGEAFSYGLLTKIDRTDGTVLSSMSFGDPSFSSGFNAVVVHGDRAVCVGWTRDYYAGDGRFQAWFTDIAVGGPAAPQHEAAALGTGTLASTCKTSGLCAMVARPEGHGSRP